MTIKDMAAAFYVIDPDKPGDGSDKVATINCHNSKGSHGGLAGIVGADNPTLCNHPEFLINRYVFVSAEKGAGSIVWGLPRPLISALKPRPKAEALSTEDSEYWLLLMCTL